MAIDYADYHPDFKKIARYIIYNRAKNCCETCGVQNNAVGHWERTTKGQPPTWVPLYVRNGCRIFDSYSKAMRYAKRYNVVYAKFGLPKRKVVKLACAHLDHDIANNELDNLKALCQGCHRHHDSTDNALRRKYGPTGQHRYQPRLFDDCRYAPSWNVPKVKKEPRKKRKYELKIKRDSISKRESVPTPAIGNSQSHSEQPAKLGQ